MPEDPTLHSERDQLAHARAELARMIRSCLDLTVDSGRDAIPLPRSVQSDVERFPRQALKTD